MKLNLQIKDLLKNAGLKNTEIFVSGWARSRRDSKAGFSFIDLHDGSCFNGIQVIADAKLANYQSEILQITTGCSLQVRGKLVESEGKGQAVEIQADEIKILGLVEDAEHYPVAKKRHSVEFLRTIAHLRPRTNLFGALTRVRHQAQLAIHQYFTQQNFFWVNTPIITASDCEGAGDLFQVSTLDLMNLPKTNGAIDFSQDFFGEPSYLTVSGQLNVESYCLALSRVYTFGPTFRAENSNTSRHLAEFWMVEPEIAFADLDMDASLAEDFLKYVIKHLLEHCPEEFHFFNQFVDKQLLQRLDDVCNKEFVRMDYTDAIDYLKKSGQQFEFPIEWGHDLQSEHERYLCEKYVQGPVVLMNYPQQIKAFYMRENEDGKTCAAMDVLVPGVGELIGGSQREERLDVLQRKMQAQGIHEELWWYSDLRRYGTVPHAGFGLGFERLLAYVTGVENVRDLIPFPRTPKSAHF